MSSLPTRLISAFVAVALLFSIRAFWKSDGLFLAALVLICIGLIEFTRFFAEPFSKDRYFKTLFVVSGVLTFASSYESLIALLFTFWMSCTTLFIYLLLRIRREDERRSAFQTQSLSAIGLFYCSLSAALTCQVLKFPNGPEWFLTILAIVFFGDSFAFFSGYFFGKKKLHPLVSPKKTWAGAIGGIFGSALFGYLFTFWLNVPISPAKIVAISIFTGAIGQFGDLFESLMKRVVGVKDSGSIMPGHGGILDRIDGVLFSGPVYYMLLQNMHYSS